MAATPLRPAPSPGIAQIVGATLTDGAGTPVVTDFKARTAQDIVEEIENIARLTPLPPRSPLPDKVVLSPIPVVSPVPDAGVLSDAAESISDGDILSDASDSEDESEQKGTWASVEVGSEQKSRVKSEKMFTIEENEEVVVSQANYISKKSTEKKKYTSEYAMKLVREQVDAGDFEQVVVKSGEGINISVEFTGKPAPHATWVRENGLPAEAQVKNTEESTTLNIENASKEHEGIYGLLLQNDYGAQAAAFKVILQRSFHK